MRSLPNKKFILEPLTYADGETRKATLEIGAVEPSKTVTTAAQATIVAQFRAAIWDPSPEWGGPDLL